MTTGSINTADLSVFAEPGFDARAWINAACAGRPQQQDDASAEPLERFLAELEMRLQLGSEEVEQSLTEVSTAALRRVPFAHQEVSRLKGDVGALQASARSLLTTVAVDAEAAAAAAAPLAALHTARTNMEAGCATLREAAELSGAFRRVEEVFAAGDLPRVADMLRSMARSLALVGDVPEFREGKGKLAALEDRLQRRVEGRLGEALQANNSSEVASLASLLLAVGRYSSLEAAYITSRLPLIAAMWDEAAAMLASANGSSIGSSGQPAGAGAAAAAAGGAGSASAGGLAGGWLLLLYNNVVGLLEGDAAWLGGCLEQQRQQLLVALMGAAFDKLNKSIAAKLSAVNSTRLLGSIMGDVQQAARRLRELLGSILAAAASVAAVAAAGGGGGSSGQQAGAGDSAGLLKHGSSAAMAADGSGAKGSTGVTAAAAAAEAAVRTEVKLLRLLLDPLEAQVSKYLQLEEPVFAAQLSAPLPVPTSSSTSRPQHLQHQQLASTQQQQQQDSEEQEELDAEVALKLDAACMGVFQCLAGVLERCVLLTGGTELPQLQSVFDKQVAAYLQRLLAAVGIINARYSRLAASGSPTADVSMMLQLVLLARSVTNRLNSLETQLRSNLATAIPRLQQLAAAGLPPPVVSLSHSHGQHQPQQPQQQQSAAAAASGAAAAAGGMTPAAVAAAAELLPLRVAAFPGKLQPLERVRQAAASSRFMSLPSAHAAGAALIEAITNAVYGALLSPVTSNLRTLPGLREWTAAAPGAAGGVVTGAGASVPSFNAYPLPAVTAVGEYLMALPQQLEVLMGQSAAAGAAAGGGADSDQQQQAEDEEGDELAAEWLDKVVRGAGSLYADTVLQIPQLSPAGAAQLAADSEYFCNVMSALAVGPPTELITVQLFAAVSADSFDGLAAGAVAGGSADVKTLRALSAMRGLDWSPSSEGGAANSSGEAAASVTTG